MVLELVHRVLQLEVEVSELANVHVGFCAATSEEVEIEVPVS